LLLGNISPLRMDHLYTYKKNFASVVLTNWKGTNMETKIKKSKKTKEVRQYKVNQKKIVTRNLRDLKELLEDKEEYSLG
jgi:hypothetical protein